MKVPYNDLSRVNGEFVEEFLEDVVDIIEGSSIIGGRHVEEFETRFGEMVGRPAAGVSNGTDALAVILRALELEPKDDRYIYYPANTFIGSILSGINMGFKFKPFDVELTTLNAPRSFRPPDDAQAVVLVHLYGYGVKGAGTLATRCRSAGIPLIEDCSQSHFQKVLGRDVGTFGDAGFFSCYPGKNLGALGDAGVIIGSDSLVAKAKALRSYGCVKKHGYEYVGFNHRLDAIQAAFLTHKLKYSTLDISMRRDVVADLLRACSGNDDILSLDVGIDESVWHVFPVLVEDRNAFIEHMEAHEVQCVIHYPTVIHKEHTFSRWVVDVECPIAEYAAKHVVSIPCHGRMRDEEVKVVCKAIDSFRN